MYSVNFGRASMVQEILDWMDYNIVEGQKLREKERGIVEEKRGEI